MKSIFHMQQKNISMLNVSNNRLWIYEQFYAEFRRRKLQVTSFSILRKNGYKCIMSGLG